MHPAFRHHEECCRRSERVGAVGDVVDEAKIEDGVYKGEFCFGRATDALKSKVMYFGVSLTDQYVEYPEDGATEGAWMPGDDIGLAPSKGEDMARIK